MKTSYMLITPALAKEFLLRNKSDNRVVRKAWVKNLATAISRGEWVTTHQGIAFSTDGTLIDGQHRLLAIVEANTPVTMAVTYDVASPNAFMAIDQGLRKTSADVFHVPQKYMEVVRLAASFVYGAGQATKAQEGEILPLLLPFVESLHAANNTACRVLSSAPVRLAAVMNMLGGEEIDYVTTVYSNLVSLRLDALPPIARSLVILATQGRTRGIKGTPQYMNYAAAYKVFQRKNSDLTRAFSRSPMQHVEAARNLILRKLEK